MVIDHPLARLSFMASLSEEEQLRDHNFLVNVKMSAGLEHLEHDLDGLCPKMKKHATVNNCFEALMLIAPTSKGGKKSRIHFCDTHGLPKECRILLHALVSADDQCN